MSNQTPSPREGKNLKKKNKNIQGKLGTIAYSIKILQFLVQTQTFQTL